MKKKISDIFEKFKTSERVFMIIIPVFIGLLGGVGAAGLKFLIHFFQDLFGCNPIFLCVPGPSCTGFKSSHKDYIHD